MFAHEGWYGIADFLGVDVLRAAPRERAHTAEAPVAEAAVSVGLVDVLDEDAGELLWALKVGQTERTRWGRGGTKGTSTAS